jgi:hypothetical protein
MPNTIAPPDSDLLEFTNVNLKLSPAAAQKIHTLMSRTGLTRAKLFAALLAIANATIAGDTAKVDQWRAYLKQLEAEKAAKPVVPS